MISCFGNKFIIPIMSRREIQAIGPTRYYTLPASVFCYFFQTLRFRSFHQTKNASTKSSRSGIDKSQQFGPAAPGGTSSLYTNLNQKTGIRRSSAEGIGTVFILLLIRFTTRFATHREGKDQASKLFITFICQHKNPEPPQTNHIVNSPVRSSAKMGEERDRKSILYFSSKLLNCILMVILFFLISIFRDSKAKPNHRNGWIDNRSKLNFGDANAKIDTKRNALRRTCEPSEELLH